ncbi:MAG: hypothetical protein V1887_03590 [Candidatus Aenigmatarchaeota archaeon]
MGLWNTKAVGRKLDAELEYTSPRYIENYYRSNTKLHKEVVGSGATKNLKRPEWVGRYAKHHFVSVLDDKEWSNERMREISRKIVDRLEKDAREYERAGDRTAAEYTYTFHSAATGLGNDMHMEFEKELGRIKKIQKEGNTFKGWIKAGADVLGFRLGTGIAMYEVLDGPFSDAEIDVCGVKVTGRDIKYLGLAIGIGITSMISYAWGKSKEEEIWKMFRQNIKKCAEDSAEEVLRSFEAKYPDAVRKYIPKNDETIRKGIKEMGADCSEDVHPDS